MTPNEIATCNNSARWENFFASAAAALLAPKIGVYQRKEKGKFALENGSLKRLHN